MTLPKNAIRNASRSASLLAQSHISSRDFGRRRTSKRPMARAGASAQPATSAIPSTASIPSVSPRCSRSRSGSEYRNSGGWSSSARCWPTGPPARTWGTTPSSRSSNTSLGIGELNGAGEFEAIAPDQFGRRSHPADEMVLLHAEHPQAATCHHRGGGQAVVPCSDDDHVVVRHWHGTVATNPGGRRNCLRECNILGQQGRREGGEQADACSAKSTGCESHSHVGRSLGSSCRPSREL